MEQSVVEQRASLLPIADDHARERATFGTRRCDSHRVIDGFYVVLLEKPIACLTQTCLAALFIDLQVELCLFVRRFVFHDYVSFLF